MTRTTPSTAIVVNPARVDALRVGDPRRARAAHDPDRRGAPLERRRAGGVAAPLGRLRPRRRALRRPRPRRLQDGPRLPQGARNVSRIDRLRELPRRAAARHEPRQRPLPDRLRQLERRASRRAGARAALHRLPLHRDGTGDRGRRGGADEALAHRLAGGEPLRPDRLRGERPPLVVRRAAAGGRRSSSCRGRVSSSSCARSRTRASSRRSARVRDHRPDVRAARERGAVRRPPRARRRLGHHAASTTRKGRRSRRSRRSSAPARTAPGRTRAPATA